MAEVLDLRGQNLLIQRVPRAFIAIRCNRSEDSGCAPSVLSDESERPS